MLHVYVLVLSLKEGFEERLEGLENFLLELGEVEEAIPNTLLIASEKDLDLEKIGKQIKKRFTKGVDGFFLAELATEKEIDPFRFMCKN